MTKDKALQMAINALTNCSRFEEAIQACKEALEQPSWRGLSPEEKMIIKIFTGFGDYEQLICAIEQALKEKNG
jgi:tetratricopeptide (TPR) repeat protein